MTVPLRVDRRRFAGKRCVVTGGLGFIGSNVALALVEAGADVTVVDALVEGHGGDPANVDTALLEVLVADVGDAEAVEPVIAGADCVFDLAGQISHLASVRDPERDLAHNTIARLRLLSSLQRVNPGVPAVFASTRQVYGRAQRLPTLESDLPGPVDVNGVAKLAAEHLYLLHHAEHGLGSVILRLSNVYGPRQHLRRDDLGVIPVFIRQALRGETLTVFGDGSEERDAVHVEDAVEAFLAAAVTPHAVGRIVNIGGPDALSLRRIAELTAQASPAPTSVALSEWPREYASLGVGSVRLSSELAGELLGWRPRLTYEAGIAQTMDWFARHPERYR
jgi:UDP-glucose 4-epimerase